jgi:hypothetical protein
MSQAQNANPEGSAAGPVCVLGLALLLKRGAVSGIAIYFQLFRIEVPAISVEAENENWNKFLQF